MCVDEAGYSTIKVDNKNLELSMVTPPGFDPANPLTMSWLVFKRIIFKLVVTINDYNTAK
jgi:hypothetical protein